MNPGDVDALLGETRIVAPVHLAVLPLLAREVVDRGPQVRILDPVGIGAHALDEKALALREERGHRVEEAGLERIARHPPARDFPIEAEIESLAGHDPEGGGRLGGHAWPGASA